MQLIWQLTHYPAHTCSLPTIFLSRKTVQPSFSQKCSQVALVTRLPVQLCAIWSDSLAAQAANAGSRDVQSIHAWQAHALAALRPSVRPERCAELLRNRTRMKQLLHTRQRMRNELGILEH
jgi:hypothetical protein